jgi:hypothetical protein
MSRRLRLSILAIAATALLLAPAARADRRRPPAAGGGPGMVNLPYVVNDSSGNQWMIYQNGWLRQQGNMPLYSQAATLTVNGQHVQSQVNQARQDDKTGEIIFDNLAAPNVTVTRRIKVNAEGGYVRYIDVFRNTQGQEQSLNIGFQTNFNYGVATSAMVPDPKSKERQLAWVAQMQAGRALLEVYGGRGVKTIPTINFMPNNALVGATMQLSIPAGKEVALVHLHGTANSQEAAADFVESIRDAKLLADVPPAIRKLIVNFGAATGYVDDREILRGDLFDVVELRSGDVVKGTLKEPEFRLETFYGNVVLPADRIVAMMNIGQFRPRQLLVTVDGEVFGGKLAKETIDLELSSGQTTQIPLSQVARAGYRKRAGEPDEWTFDKPMVILRSGDRVCIAAPAQPIEVLTRYGMLKLQPQSVAAIAFQAEDHGVHQIYLIDGSAFAGLVASPQLQTQLGGPNGQQVSFPSAAVRRLQLTSKIADPDDDTPTLTLSNNDTLVGTLSGKLKLDTAFDTIVLDAAEIRSLSRAADAGVDVQVTLWDQTTVSGQLQDPQITCALNCGITVSVPLALVEQYSNPMPTPSQSMVERIRTVVGRLSADDWKEREQAEQQLVQMGPIVTSVLREMLPSQPPEAQQRIESILKQLGKRSAAPQPMPVLIED